MSLGNRYGVPFSESRVQTPLLRRTKSPHVEFKELLLRVWNGDLCVQWFHTYSEDRDFLSSSQEPSHPESGNFHPFLDIPPGSVVETLGYNGYRGLISRVRVQGFRTQHTGTVFRIRVPPSRSLGTMSPLLPYDIGVPYKVKEY